MTPEPITIVDFTMFMGMHSDNERTRIACKNFFVEHADAPLYMPLDHVGMCDHIVWRHPYSVQAHYYPFMDVLHSTYQFKRFTYEPSVLAATPVPAESEGVAVSYALLRAASQRAHARLFSLIDVSRRVEHASLKEGGLGVERRFSGELELLYQQSRGLVVPEHLLREKTQWTALFHHL